MLNLIEATQALIWESPQPRYQPLIRIRLLCVDAGGLWKTCPLLSPAFPTVPSTELMAMVAPTTYGSSPALILTKPARSLAAVAASASSETVPASQVNVHPLVLLSVLDHHTRRQEGAGRVIGTLLGKRNGDTVSVPGSGRRGVCESPCHTLGCPETTIGCFQSIVSRSNCGERMWVSIRECAWG